MKEYFFPDILAKFKSPETPLRTYRTPLVYLTPLPAKKDQTDPFIYTIYTMEWKLSMETVFTLMVLFYVRTLQQSQLLTVSLLLNTFQIGLLHFWQGYMLYIRVFILLSIEWRHQAMMERNLQYSLIQSLAFKPFRAVTAWTHSLVLRVL